MSTSKTWTETPFGDTEFRLGDLYEYPVPTDMDTFLFYDVKLDNPLVRYGVNVGRDDDGSQLLQIWFDGPAHIRSFSATITMHYTTKGSMTELTRIPYSTLKPDHEYIQEGRKFIIRKFPSWPYCKKCRADKVVSTRQERDEGNLVVVLYLACGC